MNLDTGYEKWMREMRSRKRILFTINLMFVVLTGGCSSDGTPTDPTIFNDGFKGITYTSDGPFPSGLVDSDDWKDDGYWDYRYPTLDCYARQTTLPRFSHHFKPNEVGFSGTSPATFRLRPVYPNPCSGTSLIGFELPVGDFRVYCAIIDDHYNILATLICRYFYEDTDTGGRYEVEWDPKDASGNFLPSDVYRCIFLATDHQGDFLFASHGDIWVKY